MSNHSVSTIARALGLNAHGGAAFGRIGNVFAIIGHQAFTGSLTIPLHQISPNQFDALIRFLADNQKRLLIKGAPLHQPPYLTVYMDSHFAALTARRMIQTAEEIIAYLNTLGLSSACVSCGAAESAAALSADGILYLCDACFSASQQELQSEKVRRENTGSYLSGLCGAVVGGVIGIVPWVLLGLIGIFAALSGLLMAWLCVFFYTKFNGRIARPMIPVIIIVLIVFTVAGVFSFWMVSCLLDGNNFHTAMNIILDDMTITGIPGDIILGLFLAGLGAFFTLKQLFRTTSSKSFTLSRP